MDHDRKRQIRLAVALSAAVLLAVALIYTSFTASSEARVPSEVLAAGPSDETYEVEGKVAGYERDEDGLRFEITNPDGGDETLPVTYSGIVPDPFREGREVIITGKLNENGVFAAEKDSLITKCPSKFSDEVKDDTNVEYVDP